MERWREGRLAGTYVITVGGALLTGMSVLSEWLLLPVVEVERVGPHQGVQHSEGDIISQQ